MSEAPLVVGLAGGTGSGKTTVADQVARAAAGNVATLPQDAYYLARRDLPYEGRAITNYDEPAAFDVALMVSHLDALIAGRAVARPVYDFTRDDRSTETVEVRPAAVIVVEGILVLHEPTLRERMTLKVYVDAPADERFIRRLERDVHERERSLESVILQYRRSVKPMHDLYVEPTKAKADLIVPEGGRNHVALSVITSFVEKAVARAPVAEDEGAARRV